MPDRPDILDLIDSAIEDWETSDDAMRWAPDVKTDVVAVAGRQHGIRRITPDDFAALTPAQVEEIGECMREAARAYTETMRRVLEAWRPAVVKFGQALRQVAEAVEAVEGAVGAGPATRTAVSPRVPTYQDARPRWQSPYGPAGRR